MLSGRLPTSGLSEKLISLQRMQAIHTIAQLHIVVPIQLQTAVLQCGDEANGGRDGAGDARVVQVQESQLVQRVDPLWNGAFQLTIRELDAPEQSNETEPGFNACRHSSCLQWRGHTPGWRGSECLQGIARSTDGCPR